MKGTLATDIDSVNDSYLNIEPIFLTKDLNQRSELGNKAQNQDKNTTKKKTSKSDQPKQTSNNNEASRSRSTSDNIKRKPMSTQNRAKKKSNITYGFWNVEGLYEKLHLTSLCEFIESLDIAGLSETFTLPGFDFNVKFPNHFALHCPATKYTKLGRPSGGLVLLIRKTLRKYIELVDTQISHVLAIKIKKTCFNTDKDLLLITMYNHPAESIFYKKRDYFSTLEQVDQFIANSLEQGQEFDLLIGGDLNARIGDWAYTEDGEDEFEDSPQTYVRDSQDSYVNYAGRTLIELCTTFGLTALSGLRCKDFFIKIYIYWTQRKQYCRSLFNIN